MCMHKINNLRSHVLSLGYPPLIVSLVVVQNCGGVSLMSLGMLRKTSEWIRIKILHGPSLIRVNRYPKVFWGLFTILSGWCKQGYVMIGWMNQAYSRLSTTHGHITDCKLLVCMYWTRLVLVRPAASLLRNDWSEKGDFHLFHHIELNIEPYNSGRVLLCIMCI